MVGLKAMLSQPPSPGSYFPELSNTVIGLGPGTFNFSVTNQIHDGFPLKGPVDSLCRYIKRNEC